MALASCVASMLQAQSPAIGLGDTVRLWYLTRTDTRIGVITALRGDSLYFAGDAVSVSDLRRIDVARGGTGSRSQIAVVIGSGIAVGILGGRLASANEVNNAESMYLGAYVGAGLGYLAAKGLPKSPSWYQVYPAPLAVQAALETPPLTVETFPDIAAGQRIRIWRATGGIVEGRYWGLLRPSSMLLFVGRPDSIPLASINGLAVGRTNSSRLALKVGAGVGAAAGASAAGFVWLLCGIAGESCDGSDYSGPVAKGAAVGFAAGAVIGAMLGARPSWVTRYSR